MKEVKFTISEEELTMLIGLSASEVAKEAGDVQIMEVAADIRNRLIKHLNGVDRFSEEQIRAYKGATLVLDTIFKLCGIEEVEDENSKSND